MKKLEKGRAAMACEGGFEALQSMLKGEYTEESTGARTIRQTGGKDRHSKVFTARGPRDRRVRLSVATAIRFYDLQDRLGFEQPSKAVEWLLLHCQPSIQALPQLSSLHPMRVAPIPQPTYVDHHLHDQRQEQEPFKADDTTHLRKEQKISYIDAVMHQNREPKFHQYNFPSHHYSALHDGPFPLFTDNHLQDSIEEDPPQSSNPSSSGASSDYPISVSDVVRPHSKVTLTDGIPITANQTASSISVHHCSTSFSSPATIHMSKGHGMQHHLDNQDGKAIFASNGIKAANVRLSVGRSFGIHTDGLSRSMSCSSFGNRANFNSLVINDEDALLMSNSLNQGQPLHADMQPIMRLPSLIAYKPNHHVDIMPQLFSTTQVNQLANDSHNMLLQGACNQSTREVDMNCQACTPSTTMNDNVPLYNKIAFQQVADELACSNMYASPSPSESTSINTLEAAYGNAGGSANNMVDDRAGNMLCRSSWNPSSGLQ